MKKSAVIGIGNTMRKDDGIGIILIEKLLEQKEKLPKNIEFIDGGIGGMNLLHLLVNFDFAMIVDAVNFGGQPGETRVFTLDEIKSKKIQAKTSTHESDFLKIIELSKQLNECPEEIIVFGVQPKDTSHGQNLSAELEKKLSSILDNLKIEIKKYF
ncbi:MAG: hydrogenase maturation protease [Candidatus Thermoplasmatota archaeon]|jgi:hydrogenase maturation protease|nr:hydrogenase maturation protease [Candidatus Thermoplasmatota archaeon]